MSECSCSNGKENKTKLIFACSGAADVGKLADASARRMAKSGFGKMYCLAAIGAEVESYIKAANASEENIVIDGCPVACGKKVFEKMSLPKTHIILTEKGFEKGKTAVDDENIMSAVNEITKGCCC